MENFDFIGVPAQTKIAYYIRGRSPREHQSFRILSGGNQSNLSGMKTYLKSKEREQFISQKRNFRISIMLSILILS